MMILASSGMTFLSIAVLARCAGSLGLLDIPNPKKAHQTAVPLVGGLSLYLILLCQIPFLTLEDSSIWLIIVSGIVVATGCIDDHHGLGVRTRFSFQIIASVAMIWGSGIYIDYLGVGWFDSADFYLLKLILTIIAVVGMTNAFNMLDGIDGLAATVAFQIIIMLVFLRTEGFFVSPEDLWIVIFLCSLFCFILINLKLTLVNQVFLGDAG